MAKVKNEKVKTTTTYEVVVTGGPEKQSKINGIFLGIHLKPFKDVTTYTVTDKDGKETIEKVVIISDKRKKVKNLYAALYKKYNVEIKILEVVTEKEEPKKK
jgi:hypothetical protein